jgi:peroxiredoxin
MGKPDRTTGLPAGKKLEEKRKSMAPNNLNNPATAGTPQKALAAGEVAPDFTLRCTPDQAISLSELRGHPVILAFYPADWSPVCGDQMALYNEILSEFHRHNATLLGLSVDGVWCHAAFAQDRHLHFPLLADFEPKGEVARQYGVYREKEGVTERALFVIDADGIIRWSYVSPVAVNPGADGILSALESLSSSQKTASDMPVESDDTDFCESDGVICAPSPEELAQAVAAMEGQKP